MNGVEEKISEIREHIRKPADLTISRVPKNTLDLFKEFANEKDFCSDYGMALKHLMDFYIGLVPTGIEHVEVEIESLKEEIMHLKLLIEQKPKEGITMANGKKIRIGGIENE